MYHEMLHKKHKFYSTKKGQRVHHSSAFRKDEQKFPDSSRLEIELRKFVSKKKGWRSFFFS
jgi:hypothetical protein